MSTLYPTQSSDLKSANAIIKATPATLVAFSVYTDETNTATLVLYDNASAASGTVIGKLKVAGSKDYGHVNLPAHISTTNGIYADITGIGAEYIVYYT